MIKPIYISALVTAALFTATSANAQESAPKSAEERDRERVAWYNLQNAALYAAQPADGWHRLDGGVMFRRVAGDATGSAPKVQDVVSVNYTGSFVDDQVFDSNQGKNPITFPLSRLIPAWQVAIPYMGIGDSAEIIVPSDMGYGPRGGGPIPGGATLKFTIELVDVVPAS